MSPRNTSGSQTDNCDRPKTISLSQPISSLSPPQSVRDRAPTAPDRRIYKCWLTTRWVPAQQEISDVRAPRVEVCKTQGWDFVTLPEGLERGLQHGTARLTRQYAPIASIAHKATGALQWLCLSTLNVLRGKARPRPRNPVNPHRQEQSASPYVRQLA